MSYTAVTVAHMVKRLNITYFLPAIQREFVWKQGQVISLFDSVMKGYPISSFLFWQLEYDNRDKWGVYKFIENVRKDITHNELASLDGVREPILVIDGQQRLTSFLIGLKGTYTTKIKWRRKDDPTAWPKQRLYLDLLKDPSIEENDDLVQPSFGFRFFPKQPENTESTYWFKVGKILDFGNETQFLSYKQDLMEEMASKLNKEQKLLFESNLDLLYSSMWRNQVINYDLETNQDYDRALDVFVRANERGEPLSTSDLLLSIMTSKWQNVNARDEVKDFVDRLNYSFTHYNNLTKDFIMKNCLVLSDLPVTYKVQNYTEKNLSIMESNWARMKDAIERCVKCVNSFGIDENNLTAKNALIPINYFLFLNPGLTLMTGNKVDVKNATAIRRWLTAALLNNVFGGSSDSILASIRSVIKEAKSTSDFPVDLINKKVTESGRRGKFDVDAVDNFLGIEYKSLRSFLAISLLYDDNNWGDKEIHQDHIFPEDMFSYTEMQNKEMEDQWHQYYELKDRVANLELLTQQENLEKSNKPFDEWIATRDKSFLKRHLIPDDPELWKFENFEAFSDKREELIADRLFTLLT